MYPSSKYRYFSLHCPISFGQQFCPNHFIHIIVDFHGVVMMANDAWMEAAQPVFIDIYHRSYSPLRLQFVLEH